MTRHLAEVTVLVDDLTAALDFFQDVLGFELDETEPEWPVVKPVRQRGATLRLATPRDEDERAAVGRQAGHRVFLFLYVDDLAAEIAILAAAGLQMDETPREEPYGDVAVFRDPFGNRWDLIDPA